MAESDTVESVNVRIQTKDGVESTVPMEMAQLCGTIRNLLEAVGDNSEFVIPLQHVSNTDLQLIMSWLKRIPPSEQKTTSDEPQTRHNNDHKYRGRTQLQPLERRFFEALPSPTTLFGMLNSAMYLDVPSIVDAGSAYVAEKIKDMNVDEARSYLNLPDDLKGWEIDQMHRDLTWIKKDDSGSSS